MFLRASYGTLTLLGYGGKRVEGQETAFFMLDGKCVFDCWFCSHARSAKTSSKFLSRMVWKEIDLSEVVKRIEGNSRVKRVCIQVVSYPGYKKDVVKVLKEIQKKPVSVSVRATSLDEVRLYFDSGADMIGISIDAAAEELYKKIRGGSMKEVLKLLEKASLKYPGKVATHIIIGLGETEREVVSLMNWLLERNITVAIFAFTPVKGTKLENHNRPSLHSYRRVQLAHYLLKKKIIAYRDIQFNEREEIASFGVNLEDLEIESIKKAFLTQGCPHCRRPFYNESPKGILYNIHSEKLLDQVKLENIFR